MLGGEASGLAIQSHGGTARSRGLPDSDPNEPISAIQTNQKCRPRVRLISADDYYKRDRAADPNGDRRVQRQKHRDQDDGDG